MVGLTGSSSNSKWLDCTWSLTWRASRWRGTPPGCIWFRWSAARMTPGWSICGMAASRRRISTRPRSSFSPPAHKNEQLVGLSSGQKLKPPLPFGAGMFSRYFSGGRSCLEANGFRYTKIINPGINESKWKTGSTCLVINIKNQITDLNLYCTCNL